MAEKRFPVLDPATWTDEQRKVAEALIAGPRGGVRGPFNPLLRSPELCNLIQQLGAYIRFSTSIPAPLNEIAICMAGRKWGAQYEFHSHRRFAIEAGVKPSVIDAIADGKYPIELNSEESLIYDFVTELLGTGDVLDAHYQPVLERFGERGVMDLVGAVGYYSMMSMVLNVAQVPLPEGATPPLPRL